ESLIPMTGQPILAARSMIFTIFSAITSPSEPPKTVKSWEKTATGRPSIRPWPVTTASPHGRFFCMSNSDVRWRTKVSISWKEPGSSSFSMRWRELHAAHPLPESERRHALLDLRGQGHLRPPARWFEVDGAGGAPAAPAQAPLLLARLGDLSLDRVGQAFAMELRPELGG